MAVIDFHSHILPGIDDGSKNENTSLRMMDMASAQGVEVMLATPHFYASKHRVEDFLEKREDAWNRLGEYLKEHNNARIPAILPGAEVAFFRGISNADKIGRLTIGKTNIILLEMPFEPWTDRDMKEVRALVEERKFQIILAHLERYMDIRQNYKRYSELFKLPLYVQINSESIIKGKLSLWRRRRLLINMFRDGAAHFLGSDCHGIHHRIPNLGSGRAVLKQRLGDDFLRQMDKNGSGLLQLEEKNNV